jgi:hypothetical protein
MPTHPSASVGSSSNESDLQSFHLASEAGEVVLPFFHVADGGLALIRKLGDKFNLAFYVKKGAGAEKVGEVNRIEELADARVIAREELLIPLDTPRSFRWAKLKDDVVLIDGEAISGSSDEAAASPNARLPEGLLVKFVATGTEPGKIVVHGSGKNFEISKRLLNLL